MKLVGGQSTGGEGGHQRASSWHWLHSKAGVQGRSDHALPRIANPRTARVCDQRNFFSAPQPSDDFFAAFGFVEPEITPQRFGDSEMLQQKRGVPCVFRGDQVAFLQRAQRPQRDVFEAADGGGNEVKGAWRQRWQSLFHGPI